MIKNLDVIKEKSDIVTIVGRFIDLSRAGASYKACCPFHAEKSPSFTLSPRKQLYHCFGCGASGDVFQFVQDQMKVDFVEAVEYVAKEVGERVEYEKGRENARQEMFAAKEAKDKISAINADVLQFYIHNTWSDTPPFSWDRVEVDGRAYRGETLHTFQVCYAPNNALYQASQSKRFDLQSLVDTGLVNRNAENGGYYDHFSNRTLFPLIDPRGVVVGFTGRKQPDSSPKAAKYKNSAESPLFQKGKFLYGLNVTAQEITKTGVVYIVEGQHDLLTMYEAGIKNVVATGGTAFTIDHAKLINKFADTAVLVFDADEAGKKALDRAVDLLAPVLPVKVCLLQANEEKIDPCDWIRKYGAEQFKEYLQKNTEDAIIWAIMKDWSPNDIDRQMRCFGIAGRLLGSLAQLNRDMYIRKLSEKKLMGSGVKKMLDEAVDQYLADNAPASAFTKEQQDQIARYSVYVSGRQYFVPIDDGKGVPISNFYIRSMLLIDGNSSAERVIELENINGLKVIARIRADVFTDLGAFRAWVESRGHFMLKCKAEQWTAIRDLVYDKMTVAYPITVLGQHREGFYTFRNGIFDGDVFQPCNDLGVVQAGADHYLIAQSANFDNSKADDGNEKNVSGTFMTFSREALDGHKYDLTQWGQLMFNTYGKKSIPGMAYVLSALYRDLIYEKFTFFPHFNVFGVKGSGKNYFIESLMSLFGRVEAPVDLTSATDKALPRVMASVRNAMVWFDEYKNDLPPEVISVLRGAYGASGRTTAEKSMDNNTRRFQPRSGIIISGEHRPTKDIALYSRCCAVETSASVFTINQVQAAEKLKEIEQSGALINITLRMLRYRELIERNFYNKFREIRDGLLSMTTGQHVESRILTNWAIICTTGEVLRKEVDIPWTLSEILDIALERIAYQSSVVSNEDHLANFWRITQFLLEDNRIYHNEDVIVQNLKTLKIWGKTSRDKIDYNVEGDSAKFIFIRLARLHPLYMQHMNIQSRTTGMAIGTLEHYLQTSKWYVGKTHKKFKDNSQVCFVLRADPDFPVDLQYSKDVTEDSPF